ncbi:phage protein [Shewanella sp.]|nr:phage protein [Shewanella sp.]
MRSIPNTKEWDGFVFSNDGERLLTPFKQHSFSASELLKLFYDKQFHRIDRTQNRKLNEQVDSLRNNMEADAIREETDVMIGTLTKLKDSPIVAPKGVFSKKCR